MKDISEIIEIKGDEVEAPNLIEKPESSLLDLQDRPVTPMDMLAAAIQQNAPVEQMERLWSLNEKVEAAMAKKAYVSAMALFKKNPPSIIKDKIVSFENNDGSTTSYSHASLGNVVDKIIESLAEHGFSHRWDVEQPQGGQIEVTCVITHEQGHSESVMLSSSRDDSGKKNNIQQLSSAVTYLQRYTLLAVTGLATHEMDDDGRSAGSIEETKPQKDETFSLPAYSDEDMNENAPKWKRLILEGKSSPEHTINMLESRFTLTEEQKIKIEGLNNANS